MTEPTKLTEEQEWMEGLLAVNCAYNFRPESRDKKTTAEKCYSNECMMSKVPGVDTKNNGCGFYKSPKAQAEINKKNNLTHPTYKQMKIAVTITVARQTGETTWTDYPTTKIFTESATIGEILAWGNTLIKGIALGDLKFSQIIE